MLAGAFSLVAGYLHFGRESSSTEKGWALVNAFHRRDADGIAAMFPNEELEAIGLTRAQASSIVREIVIPEAELYSKDITRITLSGGNIALEKPKGDPRYFQPPKIFMPRDASGRRVLSLGDLLSSVWGYRRVDAVAGRSILDPAPQVEREFQRVKELGMANSFDWSTHETVRMPDHPYGPIPKTGS